MPQATSVFVGGGTPSHVPAEWLARVLGAIPRASEAEVTVECNPEDVDAALLDTYLGAGVNRVSLGVQSMVPSTLASLGRVHDPEAVHRAVGALGESGLPSFNLDLIYGAAGESLDDWCHTLGEALALGPSHVSAYALTIEAGTALFDQPERHPDDDDQADKYVLAHEALTAAGLAWYEISNWARPGHECRQNQVYWRQGDYRGIGCAAHSHQRGRRWWNIRRVERYIDAIEAGRSPTAGAEELDEDTRRLEALQLDLRTPLGVPAAALPEDPALERLLVRSAGRARLTVEGRLLANEVSIRLR